MQEWQAHELPKSLNAIQANNPNKKITLWAMDEARYSQKGYLTRGWCPTNSRPHVVKQNKFESAYLTTALRPTTGKHFSLVTTCRDSKVICCFFEEFSKTLPENEIAAVILDQAAWHKSKASDLPMNLRLIYLPLILLN